MDSDSLPLPPTPAPPGLPHIYVVNSDEEFLEMIADLFADVRVRVTLEQMRPNVEVTLANLRSAKPDLLILDIVPHRADAADLLARMEGDPALSALPVLAASTNPGLAERTADAHPDRVRAILPKPFDIDELFALLRRLEVPIHIV